MDARLCRLLETDLSWYDYGVLCVKNQKRLTEQVFILTRCTMIFMVNVFMNGRLTTTFRFSLFIRQIVNFVADARAPKDAHKLSGASRKTYPDT